MDRVKFVEKNQTRVNLADKIEPNLFLIEFFRFFSESDPTEFQILNFLNYLRYIRGIFFLLNPLKKTNFSKRYIGVDHVCEYKFSIIYVHGPLSIGL